MAGTAFLELVGGGGGTTKLQSDFGVELEPEKGLFTVTRTLVICNC